MPSVIDVMTDGQPNLVSDDMDGLCRGCLIVAIHNGHTYCDACVADIVEYLQRNN